MTKNLVKILCFISVTSQAEASSPFERYAVGDSVFYKYNGNASLVRSIEDTSLMNMDSTIKLSGISSPVSVGEIEKVKPQDSIQLLDGSVVSVGDEVMHYSGIPAKITDLKNNFLLTEGAEGFFRPPQHFFKFVKQEFLEVLGSNIKIGSKVRISSYPDWEFKVVTEIVSGYLKVKSADGHSSRIFFPKTEILEVYEPKSSIELQDGTVVQRGDKVLMAVLESNNTTSRRIVTVTDIIQDKIQNDLGPEYFLKTIFSAVK